MKREHKIAIGAGIAGLVGFGIWALTAKAAPKVYTCPYCSETFPGQELLDEHIATAHPDEQPPPGTLFTCSICGATFATQAELDAHIASTHPEQPPPPVVYTCPYCNANFATLYELNEHIASQHPTISPPVVPVSLASVILNPITYKTNDYSPTTHKGVITFSEAATEIPTVVGNLKSFWCYTLLYFLPNPFTEPIKLWEGGYSCPYCLGYAVWEKLVDSLTIGEYLTYEGGYSHKTEDELKQHMVLYHPNITYYYLCRYEGCGQSFLTYHEVVSHMVTVHKDESLIFWVFCRCPYCSQGITLGTGEIVYDEFGSTHVRLPTGKKLTEHITSSHPDRPLLSSFPVYTCSYCGRGFVTEQELVEHKTIYHPERPWILFGIFPGQIVVPDKEAIPENLQDRVVEPGTYELTNKPSYLKATQITDEGIRRSVRVYSHYKQYLPLGTYTAYAFCRRSQVVLYYDPEGYWTFLSGVPGANAKGWILKDYSIGNVEIKGLV